MVKTRIKKTNRFIIISKIITFRCLSNIFIKASNEERIRRIVNIYGIDPADAEESIRKADKQRASYYNYYATGTWGSVDNYHLCVDTGVMGINGAVELICKSIEIREKKIEEDKTEW